MVFTIFRVVVAGPGCAYHRHYFGLPVCDSSVYTRPDAAMDGMSYSLLISRMLNKQDSLVVLAAPTCFGWSLLCCAIFLQKWDDLAGSLSWVVLVLQLIVKWMESTRLCFLWKWVLFPRPKGSSLVDGFALLGSTLLHCGPVLRDSEQSFCFTCCFAVFVVSPLCLQKALSFCKLRFAFFVPRIYFLLSLRAISEWIGESSVCDFR